MGTPLCVSMTAASKGEWKGQPPHQSTVEEPTLTGKLTRKIGKPCYPRFRLLIIREQFEVRTVERWIASPFSCRSASALTV